MNLKIRAALTFIAAFCDTATFIHMHGVFSSHVTGNFVLFAAAVTQGVQSTDYLKLIIFPVFVGAVMFGTILYGRGRANPERILRLFWAVAVLMTAVALIAAVLAALEGDIHFGWVDVVLTLVLTTALGVQNAIHHFIPGPMSTVMTSTVMKTTAAITEVMFKLRGDTSTAAAEKSSVSTIWLIISFAVGCMVSAPITHISGMAGVILPALMMIGVAAYETRAYQKK